jgi:hypothetical protein
MLLIMGKDLFPIIFRFQMGYYGMSLVVLLLEGKGTH